MKAQSGNLRIGTWSACVCQLCFLLKIRPWLRSVQCEHFLKVLQGSYSIENSSNHIENGKKFSLITTSLFETGCVVCSFNQTDLAWQMTQVRKRNFYSRLFLWAHTFLSTLFLILRLRLEVKCPKFLAMVKATNYLWRSQTFEKDFVCAPRPPVYMGSCVPLAGGAMLEFDWPEKKKNNNNNREKKEGSSISWGRVGTTWSPFRCSV